MAEDFWGKIFAELHEKIDFLELLLRDTPEKDLLSWIKPNPALSISCGRFIKKGQILDRNALEKALISYAGNNQPLRKIILFSWIEKNQESMKLPSLALDDEIKKKIYEGNFGSPEKIRIMSHIDPREGARPFYQEFILNSFAEEIKATSEENHLADNKTNLPANPLEKRVQELEAAMTQIKSDNRELRKQLDNRNAEVSLLNKKLSEQTDSLKHTRQQAKQLENEISSLNSRLRSAENENEKLARQLPQAVPKDESNNESVSDLNQKLNALQKALNNRETTITRLECEKDALSRKLCELDDQSAQVKNLQKMLADYESGKGETLLIAGQLLTKARNEYGKWRWLFAGTDGRHYYLLPEMVEKTKAVIEELCLLKLDRTGKPISLTSLENSARKIIFGNLNSASEKTFLHCEDQMFPVFCEIDDADQDLPVRAVWLPEFNNRPAGIYEITNLKSGYSPSESLVTADANDIKRYLQLDLFDIRGFESILSSEHIDFTIDAENNFVFQEDYRQILNRLRMQGAVKTFCPSCLEKAKKIAMGRAADAAATCSFCRKQLEKLVSQTDFCFSGQKVIIFGGDRAGNDFKTCLEKHGLRVTWHSGFENLSSPGGSLGNPDLVLIITRQISHTLLREVSALCEKAKIRIAFSESRGLTGVLSELKRLLS